MSFPAEFSIGPRPVGPGHPTYVIAEAGANHNRDLDVARELIDVAASAGADAVKFQTYSGKTIYSRKTPKFKYLESVTDKSPSELLEDISLPREWQPELAAYARSKGIEFMSTPFDHAAVRELDALDVPALKVASFEIVDLTLVRAVAATGRPLLISTGMAVLGEIEDALNAAREAGAPAVGLMQCTSVYPAPPETINLRAMGTLERAFGVPVGLSDHSLGIAVPIAAAALGAAVVEKHFTLDRTLPGPDHAASLEPAELRAMVEGIRAIEAALGDGVKAPRGAERRNMAVARRSLVAARAIAEGEPFDESALAAKRPAGGVSPMRTWDLLGRAATRAYRADEAIE